MRFLYRFIVFFIILLLSFYLIKFPLPDNADDILAGLTDPVRDQYSVQQGISRDCISDSQKLLYDVIYSCIDNELEKILLPMKGYTENDMEAVLLSLMNDCPDFFWMDFSECAFSTDDNGITVKFRYLYTGNQLKEMRTALENEVNAIVKGTVAKRFQTEYEKAVFVHDSIAMMCRYDKSLKEADIHNAYGALVRQSAVCDGYAHAYQLVLKELGIECYYVTGDARGPDGAEGHAWNIVKLDGVYTSVDLTWDDIDGYMFESFIAPGEDITSHIYFGISEDEMRQTHKADEKRVSPLPKALDMNWFNYMGLSGDTPEEIVDMTSEVLIENINKTVPYVEIRLTDPVVFREFLETYSGEIIDAANAKLEQQGADERFEREMTCFVTSEEKGCVLIVIELGGGSRDSHT